MLDETPIIQETPFTQEIPYEYYDTIIQNLEVVEFASRVIIVWGTIFAPLIIIVGMLWWFFKQFLYRY